MNRGRNTLILLVVAAALGAYVYFVESKHTPASEAATETKAKVFDKLDTAKIDEVKVKGSAGDKTTLKKVGGKWQIVEPVQSGADETEMSGLTSNLGTLEVGRVLDQNPKDLGKYGLAQPRVELDFTATGDKNPHRLLIGNKTATGGDLYAKLGNENKVILIPAYLDTTFDRTTFALRDKSVLKFDRDKVDSVEITAVPAAAAAPAAADAKNPKAAKPAKPAAAGGPPATMKFTKQGESWKMTSPVAARTESSVVEGVIGKLATGQMKALTEQDASAADLAKYGLAKPDVQVTLGAGSSKVELLIGKAADTGELYAKDASRPMVFTVEKTFDNDIKRTPADYRTKDLFEAKPFTVTRLEVTRSGAGAATVFEKQKTKEKDDKGKEKDGPEKWAQTSPAPAKPIDANKIDDAVGKIVSLRADSFVDKLPPGAAELLTVFAKSDEGKKSENVVIHKAGSDYFATRADDAGAAKLTTSTIEDAIKSLDAVKP
jgi:hypothetical protein